MERLTHRETPENTAYVDRGLVSLNWYSMTDEGYRGPAIDRLAAYEDTGLEPEQVAELARAEKDGRLVVLPCKVGDTVYRLLAPTRRIIEREIRTVGGAADVARWLNNKSSIVQVYLTREEAEAARETLRKEGDNG